MAMILLRTPLARACRMNSAPPIVGMRISVMMRSKCSSSSQLSASNASVVVRTESPMWLTRVLYRTRISKLSSRIRIFFIGFDPGKRMMSFMMGMRRGRGGNKVGTA